MTSTVRIQHIATRTTTVVVTRLRRDVPFAEPHTLIAEDRLRPGEARSLTLHEGEIVTVHEELPHA